MSSDILVPLANLKKDGSVQGDRSCDKLPSFLSFFTDIVLNDEKIFPFLQAKFCPFMKSDPCRKLHRKFTVWICPGEPNRTQECTKDCHCARMLLYGTNFTRCVTKLALLHIPPSALLLLRYPVSNCINHLPYQCLVC